METLVKKAKQHNKDAFVELMQKNAASMYRVAKAILKNNDDVCDAMQETMLSCWEKIGTLRNNNLFKTWMIRILINHCNDIYAKRKLILGEELLNQNNSSMEQGYDSIEWKMLLEGLEEKYRTIIVLYYAEELKVREIAELLDISQSTVKKRLVEARKQIERLYQS